MEARGNFWNRIPVLSRLGIPFRFKAEIAEERVRIMWNG